MGDRARESVVLDVLFERARRLAVPFLLKSHIYQLKFALFIVEILLFGFGLFSAEKSTPNCK